MTSAIRTESLKKRFRRVDALNGLDLDVPQGAIFALVGPNGAGKTTAIKILMNIYRASSGRAEVLGRIRRTSPGVSSARLATCRKTRNCPTGCESTPFSLIFGRSIHRGITALRTILCASSNCLRTANSRSFPAACT